MTKNDVLSIIEESISVKEKIKSDHSLIEEILKVADIVTNALNRGNRIYFAGNGGSAADAQHIAAEFVSRFEFDRPGLSASSLSTDTSIITAIGNDYGYEQLFTRQLEAQAKSGDVFFGITTSGKSKNVLNGFETCRKLRVHSIALCGTGGDLESSADVLIRVPSAKTARIQESHILIGHIICGIVEKRIFG